MRALVTYGVATVMVLATAIPARARSWDVCINPSVDLNASTEAPIINVPMFFSAVATASPEGTFHQSTMASPLLNCTTHATPVGTFYAKGALVANLPTEIAKNLKDVFYVDWHFRIDGTGQFGTSGLVKSGDPGVTYNQIITGGITGGAGGLVPATGTASVVILSNAGDTFGDTVDAFNVTVP
jgi:hypothetical protein